MLLKSGPLILLILSITTVSCRQATSKVPLVDSVQDSIIKKQEIVINDDALRDSIWQNEEYLDFDELTINGKLPLITDTLSLYKLIGKPDSVITPDYDDICVSYFDKNFKQVYYQSTNLELFGDTLVLSTLNFKTSPNLFLQSGKLILNHKTTLQDIEKIYPKAVKFKGETDIYQLGKFTSINLKTFKNSTIEARWILYFEKNRLIRIDYWMPC